MRTHDEWLRQLTGLHPSINNQIGADNARFAPHKPLLLLCVLELAEQRNLDGNLLHLSADLVLRFHSYWKVVVRRWTTKPDLRLPFHHLKSQGFWEPLTKDLQPSAHRVITEAVAIDPSFLAAIKDPLFRNDARSVLITSYFPPIEQLSLFDLAGLSEAKASLKALEIQEQARDYARAVARDARFRIQVVSSYGFTCALTGYGIKTKTGANIVDAAHIHKRRDSKNDDPKNGLALSKNAHWLFDQGLWSLMDDLTVIVAESGFEEWGAENLWLRPYHGRALVFSAGASLRPAASYIAWHRKNVFQESRNAF